MTVSEFAVAMYAGCDVIKDRVRIIDDKREVYDGRMEFLRYGFEFDPDWYFCDRQIREVTMIGTYIPKDSDEVIADYLTIIHI
jgi:hypothetical protein